MPWPNETVSNLHLFHLKFIGTPTSSNCNSAVFNNLVFSINLLNFFSPTFLAINNVPTFEDLTNICSTVKSLGNSLMSDILCLEHFTDFGIFLIIV